MGDEDLLFPDEDSAPAPVPARRAQPEPSAWKAVRDKQGRLYYWNKTTGETSWKEPVETPAPRRPTRQAGGMARQSSGQPESRDGIQVGSRVEVTLRGSMRGQKGTVEKLKMRKPGKFGIQLDSGRRLALGRGEFIFEGEFAGAGSSGAASPTRATTAAEIKVGDRIVDADGLPGKITDTYRKSGTCFIDYDDGTYDAEYPIADVSIEKEGRIVAKGVRELIATLALNTDEDGVAVKGGAGLRFDFTLNGWRIKEVMEEPGQPDIQVNDVITRINGEKLIGQPEEMQHEIFRRNFEKDARLTILRKSNFKKAKTKSSETFTATQPKPVAPQDKARTLAAVRAASKRDAEHRKVIEATGGDTPSLSKKKKEEEQKRRAAAAEAEAALLRDEWSEFTAPLWHSSKRNYGGMQGRRQSNYRQGRYNNQELDKSKGDYYVKGDTSKDNRPHFNMLYGTGKYHYGSGH